MIDTAKILNAVSSQVEDKIEEKAKELVRSIVYDAMVEKVNLSELEYSIDKSEGGYEIHLNLNRLNEEAKELTKTIYYKNGRSRMG